MNYTRDQLRSLRLLTEEPQAAFVTGGASIAADELQSRRFTIGNRPLVLRLPVDWRQDPFGSRSWRFQLNTLTWLKPLLTAHARLGQRAALELARDVVVDWAAAHAGQTSSNEFAWYDMCVGLRAPCIGYVLRTCLAEDLLSEDDALLLLGIAVRHGRELACDRNYAEGHNHGLFQDEGLHLLGLQLPTLDEADRWREVAVSRLRRTLRRTVSLTEGGHLEHSSSYQFSIAALVSRLANSIGQMPELAKLRDRLRNTARWHVTPINRMAQLGDTDDIDAPAWACNGDQVIHGLKALPATGMAFVRDENSYLAVTAAHHSAAHKQADETGFLLVEAGAVLIGDAGRWGYYEDEPDRKYARSAAAHNVLVVDDQDFLWREQSPYGSGLIGAGQEGPWYAILVENPTLALQGVRHQRLLVYRPGHSLSVLDDVIATEQHAYTRHFHFGPELEADVNKQRVSVFGTCTSAILSDLDPDTSFSLHRGVDRPQRLGWCYPGDRSREPVFTATLRSCSAEALLVASIAIGERGQHLTSAEREGSQFSLAYEDGNRLLVALNKQGEIQVESSRGLR